MPPLAHDLWPGEIIPVFGKVNAARREGDAVGMARECRAAENILTALEATDPPRAVRAQIARAYFDLSSVYRELDRWPAAQSALCRARDRWDLALSDEPGDFYARTQLAGCLNWMGLMASDDGDSITAERLHLAALAARNSARDRIAIDGGPDDPTDRLHNLTNRAGVLCNLGHLFRVRGDGKAAAEYYAEAIQELESLVPKYRRAKDRDAGETAALEWEMQHGILHYTRVAAQFLDNAKWGRSQLKSRKKIP